MRRRALRTRQIAQSQDGRLTVHVIGYQLRGFSWTGAQSILDVKCLAEETGGLYITAENREDLVKAFEKTLGCPMMSAIGAVVALNASSRDALPAAQGHPGWPLAGRPD